MMEGVSGVPLRSDLVGSCTRRSGLRWPLICCRSLTGSGAGNALGGANGLDGATCT